MYNDNKSYVFIVFSRKLIKELRTEPSRTDRPLQACSGRSRDPGDKSLKWLQDELLLVFGVKTCKAHFVSKERSSGKDGRKEKREGEREVFWQPAQTTNRSRGAWTGRPPRWVRAAHASHFMNSISTGRNFQFERAIITAWGESVNCFCSIMHSDAIIFLSNYRGVSAACHPGADFQFN